MWNAEELYRLLKAFPAQNVLLYRFIFFISLFLKVVLTLAQILTPFCMFNYVAQSYHIFDTRVLVVVIHWFVCLFTIHIRFL